MATPTVDLSRMSVLTEIIVRGGDATAPDARQKLQDAYTRLDLNYADAVGISTLFREGASLDDLAREGAFPHRKLSWSVVSRLTTELAQAGYEFVLFQTPALQDGLPDHHSLAVARDGVVQPTLSDIAASALLRAMVVVDNPYRRQKP